MSPITDPREARRAWLLAAVELLGGQPSAARAIGRARSTVGSWTMPPDAPFYRYATHDGLRAIQAALREQGAGYQARCQAQADALDDLIE